MYFYSPTLSASQIPHSHTTYHGHGQVIRKRGENQINKSHHKHAYANE